MYEQRIQIAQLMSKRGQTIRYRPATGIPAAERNEQIDRLLNSVWLLATALGVDIGRKPTIIYHGTPMLPTTAVLGRASQVIIEAFATTQMVGISDAIPSAILHLTTLPSNAGTPNLQHIIDETYSDDPPETILQD